MQVDIPQYRTHSCCFVELRVVLLDKGFDELLSFRQSCLQYHVLTFQLLYYTGCLCYSKRCSEIAHL
ncbi:hypothetical protein Y032_0146g2545 [Ancylostoma ceylanicum]|uniref:Uncharacterized protein n=1 Tax=Ancylostoma ceylanicum TaxID=53326 RepID=A0A016T2A3_9BILA|nr:hypothetical protein Y032_0146g2545 [Ancylostoma ceylanicum]